MDIRNIRELKQTAARRVAGAPQEKKILLIYSGITLGLALLLVVVQYVLDLQIGQFGGLSNLSTRSMLSAVQSVLPILQSLVSMCIEVGFLAAMLRIARRQYASPNTLRLGFDRFWVLLRSALFQALIYGGLSFAAVYASSLIFVISPFGNAFMEQAMPLMADVSLLNPQMVLDDAAVMALLPTMTPMLVILVIALLVLLGPAFYRFRMANYIIIDKPGRGAVAALMESGKMMRGNCLNLLKLDLSYWWYYLLTLVITAVGSLDLILAQLGIRLPLSADGAYFVFYIAYLALQFAAWYFLRSRLEVTYALAYESIKPEEPKQEGVVLGNIFQL